MQSPVAKEKREGSGDMKSREYSDMVVSSQYPSLPYGPAARHQEQSDIVGDAPWGWVKICKIYVESRSKALRLSCKGKHGLRMCTELSSRSFGYTIIIEIERLQRNTILTLLPIAGWRVWRVAEGKLLP